jgi:hypothetical protein
LFDLTPECKGDRPAAQRLALALSSQHVLELDVAQQISRLGNEVEDQLVAKRNVTLDHYLWDRCFGRLRVRDGDRNFAFFLLRLRFRGWRCFRERLCCLVRNFRHRVHHGGLGLLGGAAQRRTSRSEQGRQYQKSRGGAFSG